MTIKPDEIARELSRLCPLDGDIGTGELHPNWDEANLRAAKHLCENIEQYRARYDCSLLSKVAKSSELAYFMAREGRKLRNNYLAQDIWQQK